MNQTLQKLNEKYVARTPHMVAIGATVTAVAPSRGTMMLPARPDWLGDPVRGMLHPGALTVLADSACGLAVGAALDKPVPYATLDLRMDYLRPAVPERDVYCEAECFRLSRSVAFVRAEVWQDDRSEPIAAAHGAFMLSTPAGTRPPAAGAVAAPQERPESSVAALPPWSAPEASAPVALERPVPYVEFLGIRSSRTESGTLFRLPYQEKLIGNPRLPALHGGVVAGFGETAALLSLIERLQGEKFPKSIDFSIDYLRSGRPEETFADCDIVRIGSRVALVQVRCWQKNPGYPIAVMRGHFLLTERDAI